MSLDSLSDAVSPPGTVETPTVHSPSCLTSATDSVALLVSFALSKPPGQAAPVSSVLAHVVTTI